MAVYIDNVQIPAVIRNGSRVHDSQWSHLVADTPRELHDFATRVLNLQRAYFQDHWPHPHYDLTTGKRAQALARGAVDTSSRQTPGLGRWLPPVLVTSSRDGVEVADIEAGLKPHFDARKVLISGGARGGDRLAESQWQVWGGEIDRLRVSAEAWNRSRGAGYARNATMVSKAAKRGGECVALVAPCTDDRCTRSGPHGTHGASHCADLAHAAGLQVHTPPVGGQPSAWQPKAEPARHDWQPTGDRNRKECECGITAVRSPVRGSWTIEFLVPGLPPVSEPPPHFGAGNPGQARPTAPEARAETPAQIARAPRPSPAARIRGTAFWWDVRYQIVECDCGETLRRVAGETYTQCLECSLREKTAAAGPDVRAGIARIQEWNASLPGARERNAVPPGPPAAQRQDDREAGL